MEMKMEIKPLEETADGVIVYKCGGCGASDIRLWRRWNTFVSAQSLTCKLCSEIEQGVELGERGDEIGNRIPAVPTEEGDTFWGYSSVPDDAVKWWIHLPESQSIESKIYSFIVENYPFSDIELYRMVGGCQYKKVFTESLSGCLSSSVVLGKYVSAGLLAVMNDDLKESGESECTYKITVSERIKSRLRSQRSKHITVRAPSEDSTE